MTTTTGKPIPVHVVMVLDESGSMGPLRGDLIGGVNKFLADQRAEEGKCRLTLVKFAPYRVLLSCGHRVGVDERTAEAITRSAEVSHRETGKTVPTLRCPRCGKVGTLAPGDAPPAQSTLVQTIVAPPRRPGQTPPKA